MLHTERNRTTPAQWDAYVRNFFRDALRQVTWPAREGEPMTVKSENRHYRIDAEGHVEPLVAPV